MAHLALSLSFKNILHLPFHLFYFVYFLRVNKLFYLILLFQLTLFLYHALYAFPRSLRIKYALEVIPLCKRNFHMKRVIFLELGDPSQQKLGPEYPVPTHNRFNRNLP